MYKFVGTTIYITLKILHSSNAQCALPRSKCSQRVLLFSASRALLTRVRARARSNNSSPFRRRTIWLFPNRCSLSYLMFGRGNVSKMLFTIGRDLLHRARVRTQKHRAESHLHTRRHTHTLKHLFGASYKLGCIARRRS